jgi:hypothetical protein
MPTVVLVAIAAALALFPARSRVPFAWDPVNFALALDRIDLLQHQPHPPPAVGYVVAGRLFRAVVGDANLALVAWNLLMTALTVVVLFVFAVRAAPSHAERHGWLAVAVLLGSPLLWFYGCVAEIYATEMALMLVVAYGCLRLFQGSPPHAYLCAAALAVLGAFRPSGVLFVLPLAAVAFWRLRTPARLRACALFAALTAAWAVPLLLTVGPATYLSNSWGHFVRTAGPTSAFTGASARELNRHVRDAAVTLASGLGPFGVLVWPLFLFVRRPRWRPAKVVILLTALWALPCLLFYVLVHMAKPGYLLPLVPVLCLAAAFHYGQEPRATVRWMIALLHVVAGALFFLVARPWTGAEIGEGLRYSGKTLPQKARSDLNGIYFPTRHTIEQGDRQLEEFQGAVQAACHGAHGSVIVGEDGPGLNWRRLMYAFPEAVVVRVPAPSDAAVMVAQGRRFEVQDGPVELAQPCPTFWVLSEESQIVAALRGQATVQTTGAAGITWHMTQGEISVALSEGVRASLR